MRPRAVLALTPDLAASDANRMLLSLLDELGRAGAVDPSRTRIVACEGGPLGTEIGAEAELAAARVVGAGADRIGDAAARLHPRARSVGERVGLSWGLARHPARPGLGPPDVVWAHGADALTLAEALPRPARRAPLVVHLLEGPIGLARAAGPDAADRLARARLIVVSTSAMREHLVAELGLPRNRIAVHPPWLLPPPSSPAAPAGTDAPPAGATGATSGTDAPAAAGGEPDLPEEALVVAGGGPAGWRAGTDVFLALAARLPSAVDGRPVHHVWVGRPETPGAAERLATDIALRGLAGRVHVVEADGWRLDRAPTTPTPTPTPAVVVVTAREGPLPRLALDAARRSIPVLGHRPCGLADVLPPGLHDEAVVELFAGDRLADRVAALLADPAARASLGAEQGAHVARHHDAGARVAELWTDVALHLARG